MEYDTRIFLLLNSAQGWGPLDRFFIAMSWLGEGWLIIPLALALVLMKHGRTGIRVIAACSLAATFITLLGFALKESVARARPVAVLGDAVRVLGPRLEAHSMPSGHSLLVFMILGFLCGVHRRLAWLWLPFAMLVGVSRIYVGAHFPADVVAGAALGFVPALSVGLRVGSSLRTEGS